jgi:DNA-binding XRE family transcriptional regulator
MTEKDILRTAIRILRAYAGLKKWEFAKKVGIDRSVLSRIEGMETGPSPLSTRQITKAFGEEALTACKELVLTLDHLFAGRKKE